METIDVEARSDDHDWHQCDNGNVHLHVSTASCYVDNLQWTAGHFLNYNAGIERELNDHESAS